MDNSGSGVPGMRKNCDQRWEKMQPMGPDRYCLSCTKRVVDLTGLDRPSIRAWFKAHPNGCGMFHYDQVDRSIIPLPGLATGIRRGLGATLTALAVTTAIAQEHRAPQRVEQGMTQAPSPLHSVEDQRSEKEAGLLMGADGPVCDAAEAPPMVQRPPARVWYLSARPPFLHRRARYRVIGCPSF